MFGEQNGDKPGERWRRKCAFLLQYLRSSIAASEREKIENFYKYVIE